MINDKDFKETLLQGWEDVYLKSQLTLWLLISLKAGEKHMAEIKSFVEQATNHRLSPDDKSMYRTLRRLTAGEMIQYVQKPAKKGPDYKVFGLTGQGQQVLHSFLERNIISVFYKPELRTLIEKG